MYDTSAVFGEEKEEGKPKETPDLAAFVPQPGTLDPLLAAFGPQPGTRDPFLDAFGPQPGSNFFSMEDFPQPRGFGGFIGFDDPSPPAPLDCLYFLAQRLTFQHKMTAKPKNQN